MLEPSQLSGLSQEEMQKAYAELFEKNQEIVKKLEWVCQNTVYRIRRERTEPFNYFVMYCGNGLSFLDGNSPTLEGIIETAMAHKKKADEEDAKKEAERQAKKNKWEV